MTDQTEPDLYRRQRQHIELADDTLVPRREFAAEIGVSDKTASRMNLPTTYIGNVAFVTKKASLEIIAKKVKVRRRSQR